MSHEPLYCLRHSLSHVLAQAVQRSVDPHTQLGTGPAIEDGFYYDMKLSDWIVIGEDQLKWLTQTMGKITKEWQSFGCYTAKDKDEAIAICQLMQQSFKEELVHKFSEKEGTKYTFYYNTIALIAKDKLLADSQSDYIHLYETINQQWSNYQPLDGRYIVFLDLCEGGHVENTKEITDGCFVLHKISGAYRQWKEENPQMTRVYGLALGTKEELKTHLTMLEEAKKRDHRIIGAKMKLFTLSPLVGSGLPLFQPNGMTIRKELTDYLRSLHQSKGYQRVWTPHLAKADLYKTSWHREHYAEDLFHVHGGSSGEEFCIKPMNCPHHMQLFADNQFSYRDMPVRYFEPATVYRDEKTWQLWGLTRVRAITQDDGHLFCRPSQIAAEIQTIVSIIQEFYATMGMLQWYRVSLSLRGSDKTYLWSDEIRDTAETALKDICNKGGLNYKEMPGEAAFYGPKLDFMFQDAIGRRHQLATCQIDFNLPERFDLTYINEQWEPERPVVIHRAISGSIERFMGVMIEQFAGNFPLWLAPEQVRIITVADKFDKYANQVCAMLTGEGLRATIDQSDDSFSKKIRNAELEKVTYVAIVGEKEESDSTVSIRNVRTKAQYTLPTAQRLHDLLVEYRTRKL